MLLLMLGGTILTLGAGAPQMQPDVTKTPKPTDYRKVFAPGVRIDWKNRLVEVDATVVLREGPLELLACSPHTKEHESILAVRARPMHVFQAMGLIGLQPGSPARYDREHDQWHAPNGDALELRVCHGEDSARQCPLVEDWLMDINRRRPPARVNWVFAGSRTLESRRFGADAEGTVVCVVDFDTALMAIGALHSADNELLWLVANTEAIPPVGTPCTLVIRSAAGRLIEVDVAADGGLRIKGRAVSPPSLVQAIRRETRDITGITFLLHADSGASAEKVQSAVDSLTGAGIDRGAIRDEQVVDEPGKVAPRNDESDG
jgi:hypothetical protein